jgi:hypothetical protein
MVAAIATWMAVEAEAVELTTAIGWGADTYINDGVSAENNYGANTTMLLRRASTDYTRKVYVRFDTWGLHATDVTLRFTVDSVNNQSDDDTTVNVWGLNDGVLGDENTLDEFWPEMEINWNNAPGNLGGNTVDPTKTSLLGTFLVPQDASGGTVVTFNNPNLLSMIQNDTNGVITLILQPAAGTDYIYFRTKEYGTATNSPTLVFPAAACIWDGEGGANKNWSHASNWAPDVLPLDAATFTNAATAAAGTVTSIVDEDFTVGTLAFEHLSTAANGWHTMQINDGVTLRVLGALGVSADKAIIFGNFTADGTTRTAFSGGGTLLVDSPTKDFWVGGRAGASAAAQSNFTIDMSGLANFEANIDEFRLAASPLRSHATVTLAEANAITANAVVVGANSHTAPGHDYLYLGRTNVVNTNKLVVAGARSTATLAFNPALPDTPTLVLRGKAGGSSRANVWIGDQNGNSGYGTGGTSRAVGTVDWTAGVVDAMIGNLIVARNGTYYSGKAGAADGTLSFAAGTIDATQIVLGRTPIFNTQLYDFNDPLNTGTLNMLGGTLVAGSMILGEVQGHGAPDGSSSNSSPSVRARGIFNLSGGTAIVNGDILLGNHTSTGTADAIGTVNFTGGTLAAQYIGPGSGTNNVSTFNWTDGTLHVGTFGLDLVQNGGTLAPGTSIGTTHVLGDYTQNAGVLEIEFQSPGLVAGVDYDVLEVAGLAMLDGTLVLSLLGGYQPEIGSVFDVLTADGITFGPNFALVADENFVARLFSGPTGDMLQFRYVPEPSSLALLGIALIALAGGSRRRRCRAELK